MHSILLVVAFSLVSLVVCLPDPGVIYAAAPEERGAFHIGGAGVYSYGYNTGDGIAKVEVKNPDGSVTGSYRYYDPFGRQIVRSYIADSNGFRVLGNELPGSINTPTLGLVQEQTLVGPTEGERQRGSASLILASDPPTFASSMAKYNLGLQKHENAIRKQQALIRQQTELLEGLQAQKNNLLFDQQQSQQRNYQVHQTQSGYIESSNNAVLSGIPYLYAPDDINYDFPAGFAYNAAPVVQYRIVYSPVSVKGEHEENIITAGHLPNRKQFTYRDPNYVRFPRRRPEVRYRPIPKRTRTRDRNFIIGHMK